MRFYNGFYKGGGKLKKISKLFIAAAIGLSIPISYTLAAPATMDGWVQSRGTWYYYSNGAMIKGGWAQDSTGWAFLNAIDGSWMQQGWVSDSKGWCYLRNGYWVGHATWAMDTKGWQYIGADGYWDPRVTSKLLNPIDEATAAVAKAERTKLIADIGQASTLVNGLDSALPEKSALNTRVKAVSTVDDSYKNTFDYKSIGELISSTNSTVQSNKNIISKLSETTKSIDAAISQLEAYAATIAADPAKVTEYNSTLDKIKELKYQKGDTEVVTGKVALQAIMAIDQITFGGENLIITYKTLELENSKLDENIISLQRNIEMTKLYKSQGMATDTDINKLQLNLDNLKYTKSNLERQMANIKMQLNQLIAKPYDDTARIVFDTTLLNSITISGLDKQADMDKAMANNYNIKLEYYSIKTCNNALSRASSNYGTGSSQYAAALYDFNSAVLKQDETIRSEKLKFSQNFEDLKDKQAAVNLEKNKFEQEKINLDTANIKYGLGMISKKALDDAVTTYNLQSIALDSAKYKLFLQYRTYEWMLKGLIQSTSTTGSSAN